MPTYHVRNNMLEMDFWEADHTAFGQLVNGMEVLKAIENGDATV